MPGQDEALVRQTLPIRIYVSISVLVIIGIWLAGYFTEWAFSTTVAWVVTAVDIGLLFVVMMVRAARDTSSGVRPEGGVPWDGDVGNPNEENPRAIQELADRGEDVDGDNVPDGGPEDGGLPPRVPDESDDK